MIKGRNTSQPSITELAMEPLATKVHIEAYRWRSFFCFRYKESIKRKHGALAPMIGCGRDRCRGGACSTGVVLVGKEADRGLRRMASLVIAETAARASFGRSVVGSCCARRPIHK